MENKNPFPHYTGFGKLRRETICESENEISADYYFLDHPVHHLTRKSNGIWEMHDYDDEVLYGRLSRCPDFGKLMHYHFSTINCESNAPFKLLSKAVTGLGNIYFEHFQAPEKEKYFITYNPAGRILMFCFPVLNDEEGERTMKILIDAMENEQSLPEGMRLAADIDAYTTKFFEQKKSGELVTHKVMMLEIPVPLAFTYDLAKWICDKKMIRSEKKFRAMIRDSSHKLNTGIQTFFGKPEDEYLSYHVLFKGMLQDDKLFEELRDVKAKAAFEDLNKTMGEAVQKTKLELQRTLEFNSKPQGNSDTSLKKNQLKKIKKFTARVGRLAGKLKKAFLKYFL
jgi:hypothetical protein